MSAPTVAVTDIGFEDFAAVSKIVRSIDRQEHATIETLANWKLAAFMFRQLDLRFAMAKAPEEFRSVHRALLTALLATTERLDIGVQAMPESDLNRIGLTQQAFGICLKNLRGKYKAWYVPMDPEVVREFNEKLAALSQ